MNCPSCRLSIPDDSRYCDLCGIELPVCPLCGKSGSGKRCIFDGTLLVYRGGEIRKDAEVPSVSETARNNGVPFADEIILTGRGNPIVLEIRDNDVIGRTEGRLAGHFQAHPEISGRHAGFRRSSSSHWTITDYGSTNGTFLDGHQIPVMRSESIRDGMVIRFADLEFVISITGERQVFPAATVRIRLERDGRK